MTDLHPTYSLGWFIVVPGAFLMYLSGQPRGVQIFLAIGMLLEGLALWRKKEGDTLSEHLWSFWRDKPARLPLVLGFTLWLLWAAVGAFERGRTEVWDRIPFDVGLWAVVLGFLGWLVPHMVGRGKYG